jgi:hypothetical protein
VTVTRVYLEVGSKRVFASALEWPGWCRPGKDEEAAVDALKAAAPRYLSVAAAAGFPLVLSSTPQFEVEERVKGTATTDFGAPGVAATSDAKPLNARAVERQAALVKACWAALDQVVATAPAELRRGPRGGGRDRDQIFDHILDAESAYARKLGIKPAQPGGGDRLAVVAFRAQIIQALSAISTGSVTGDRLWQGAFAARRIAWHSLDHAWEIEDRSD